MVKSRTTIREPKVVAEGAIEVVVMTVMEERWW
jgi:hypothetical protein